MATSDDREISWQDELRANVRMVGLAARSAPVLAATVGVLTLVEAFILPLVLQQTGRFLNLLGAARAGGDASVAWNNARGALVAIGVAILIGQAIKPLTGAMRFGMSRRFQAALAYKVMDGVTGVPGLAHFEDPGFRDKLEVSDWIGWAPGETIWILIQMIQSAIQLGALTVLAGTAEGWMVPLLLGTAIPPGVAAFNRVRSQGLAIWTDSPEMKRASYYRSIAIDLEPAKEMRIFGLRRWTMDRQHEHWLNGMRETWRRRRTGSLLVMGLRVISIGGLSIVYLALLSRAIDGVLAPGAFFTASVAAVQVLTNTVAVFQSAAWVRRMNYLLPVVLRLVDLPRTDPRMDATGTRTAHGLTPSGIRFEGVRFHYPGTGRWILDGCDLFIPAGQSIALVGENGAGKTTLIKLLCRFYDPDEGRIMLDGVDIRTFDIADYRRRLSCIFQDFARYELPARDNVGFGSVENRGDTEMVREAARRVGVLDEIERMPDGWETPLSRAFDGVDLSGGQWQRIALARAIMAQLGHDADVLILDEPTASLDVRLEHELYEHFAQLAEGRTTMLVSHRFSTVRMAQRIVFLEGGRVVEDGTHDDLVARGGRYAELYQLQAAHYIETGALE